MKHDLYGNSLMTFDRNKESKRLQQLNNEDLLLDFHSQEEFVAKIDFYFKKRIRENNDSDRLKRIKNIYKSIFTDIMNILKNLDPKKI